jgi:hypothetical protein
MSTSNSRTMGQADGLSLLDDLMKYLTDEVTSRRQWRGGGSIAPN